MVKFTMKKQSLLSDAIPDNYQYIQNNTETAKNKLESQISTIELRQQELQSYINSLQTGITNLENIIQIELNSRQPDHKKIYNLRQSIMAHIESITRLYDSYNKFEDTKLKCQKEINEVLYKNTHLLEISIKQIDDKINKVTDTSLTDIMAAVYEKMKTTPVITPPITTNNEDNSTIEQDIYSL